MTPTWDPRSPGTPPERLPLGIGSRTVGLLVLEGDRDALTSGESRILRAFGDQLALVLERDRLLRSATDAEVYRQSEKLRQTLFAAVSHDLRSPLAAIKATVTDLLDDDVDRSALDRREALDAIDVETERLDALIANLLDMSRIQAGVLQARLDTVDLSEVVAASVRTVRRAWPGVEIRLAVPEGSVVRVDVTFLDRVLWNLLDNAARAASASGTGVEVRATEGGGRVTVRVIDHGAGVPIERQEALFHPFYELDPSNPRIGRGLGLAIAKGFVVAMGGEITLEETPGGGATFAVTLEAADARPRAVHAVIGVEP
jgi:two-component system sensor histidine kinase KdpD